MIKHVIFDWNGTIIADLEAVVKATSFELAVFGKEPVSVKEYQDKYEVPISKFWAKFGISQEIMEAKSLEAAKAFHGNYEPLAARVRTRTGARKILSYLQEKNISTILLSNHTAESIYLHLERLKIHNHFSTVLANDFPNQSHFSGKLKRLEDFLSSSHINANNCLIVGDTTEEIEIGKKLGMVSAAITGGYNSTKRLTKAKSDHLINNLGHLEGIIRSIK